MKKLSDIINPCDIIVEGDDGAYSFVFHGKSNRKLGVTGAKVSRFGKGHDVSFAKDGYHMYAHFPHGSDIPTITHVSKGNRFNNTQVIHTHGSSIKKTAHDPTFTSSTNNTMVDIGKGLRSAADLEFAKRSLKEAVIVEDKIVTVDKNTRAVSNNFLKLEFTKTEADPNDIADKCDDLIDQDVIVDYDIIHRNDRFTVLVNFRTNDRNDEAVIYALKGDKHG